ncbi:UNVERIFIED_CONTAM: hypothetical protein Sradi_7178900 [Sesamum radiatum]|uniref:Uncharacterized protein n=1 Tax=Sesamum radiatum TaxID=300843 RepID=A0AAW2IU84_SESRA
MAGPTASTQIPDDAGPFAAAPAAKEAGSRLPHQLLILLVRGLFHHHQYLQQSPHHQRSSISTMMVRDDLLVGL